MSSDDHSESEATTRSVSSHSSLDQIDKYPMLNNNEDDTNLIVNYIPYDMKDPEFRVS